MKSTTSQLIFLATTLLIAQSGLAQCQNNLPPQNPNDAYLVHDDGTVTDLRTGLMWKRCSEGQDWNGSNCIGSGLRGDWAFALNRASQSSFAGYQDWRMPNVKELGSLVEHCRSMPAINTTVFPNTILSPNPAYWTASPTATAGAETRAWFIGFDLGYSLRSQRTGFGGALMRLVRTAD
jgi:nucleoside-specific outer membrane channel protein Tsx